MSRVVVLSWEASARRAIGLQCVRSHPLRLRDASLACSRGGVKVVGRYKSTTTNDTGEVVTIGDVSMRVRQPKHPELVPVKYLPDPIPQTLIKQLRWIMQKDLLGQDVFLIGPPGPLRRTIAMMYLELTRREVEYVSLSRDTTEMDLKQRREIRSNSAFHIDQSAVKAALEGRVLVLEGIEKAERNVLPVLNNLLENREMQLDDGRFLMAADRYDKLLKDHSQEELDAWKLVRVSEDFRVIALGLPVPRYQGNPLDPPLRSRFQAMNVDPLPFKDHLAVLNAISHGVPPDRLSQILSFALTLKSDEAKTLGLPDFPLDNLHAIIKILTVVPSVSTQRLLQRLYPYDVMLGKEGQTAVVDALKSFSLLDNDANYAGSLVTEVRLTGDSQATVQVKHGLHTHELHLAAGTLLTTSLTSGHYVNTHYHDQLLTDMMESHLVKDFCLIGPPGCGKSIVAKQFAELLGYHLEPIMLYQDMGARDLLQQRITRPNGDTAWQPSPLVKAALDGSLAVLDGVHRINPGTFAVLHRLIHDRELSLFDGTRLLRHDRYDKIKEENKLTEEDMTNRGVFRIHPAFRIIALSEPPVAGSSNQQWLNSEQLTMFLYHNMRPLSWTEELNVIHKLVPGSYDIEAVMRLTHKLRESNDSNLRSLASSLSTRQLLRIARRLAKYPQENVYDTVHKACLARFLPRLTRTALEEELSHLGVNKPELPSASEDIESAISCGVTNGVLRIGSTEVPVYATENKMKVPDVLFYDNHQHLLVMEDMLKDFVLGEHLLLVGNQGVGKNKVVDRFLSLLNRPREYLQLHRDTTVQTLTLQPTVREGVIVYEDSPLVRAVKTGHILIVDEADKAPTNVTCILKTLVESGEMHLADGRKIVKESDSPASDGVIVMHPEFRMVVLANRPGFPFLGNDFFSAMGDIFSAHAVNNPDIESEMDMLRNYGPDVPEDILRKLVLAFSELRDLADQGLITYPYSTREVVNMVRHLQKFPSEGLVSVVRNVFDFDSYNPEVTSTVVQTLHKHGIPMGADPRNIHLAKEFPMPEFKFAGQWHVQGGTDLMGSDTSCPVEEKTLRIKGPVTVRVETYTQDRTDARSILFSEQEAYWTLPLHETSVVKDVAVTKASQRQSQGESDVIHIATANPISLYSVDVRQRHISCIDLYDIFPSMQYRPTITLATLSAPMDHNVIVHEASSNIILNVNWQTGEISRIDSSSLLEAAAEKLIKNFRSPQGTFKMCSEFCGDSEGLLLFYKLNSQSIEVIHLASNRCHSVQVPMQLGSVLMMSKDDWLITEAGSKRKYLLHHGNGDNTEYSIKPIEDNTDDLGQVEFCASQPLHDSLLSAALQQQTSAPNRILATRGSYATVALGLPDLDQVELHTAPREGPATQLDNTSHVIYLPDTGQVVRAVAPDHVPKKVFPHVFPQGVQPKDLSGYLEVCDLVNRRLRYLPVPTMGASRSSMYWFRQSGSEVSFVTAAASNDGVVTVDGSGCVRVWETALGHLQRSIGKWRGLIGEDTGHMQITIDRDDMGRQATAPKHGRVDPTGNPHVGGNTWAGGTGGRDTAGLGGVGGPYRLDGGHTVHQVSDAEKAAVPEEVRRAAREMGKKAFQERLREIEMSEYDASVYEKFSGNVKSQVKSIRIMLDSLQAKGRERQWMRNQTSGDLDEARLIEGLAGEKAIYRRRGEKEPEMGSPQQKPKMMQILCDVSGSMYRFNGHDGRLAREMEAMVMIMEALEDYEQKIKYAILGHSGEGHKFDIVKVNAPPKNNKERLTVIETLHAHAQFCLSGDYTLEAARHAVNTIVSEDADEHFVIVLSDANFDRYGIPPKRFADILTSNEDVNAYVIFIGSLGDQAHVLMNKMPSGRAFLCLDTKDLPQILQQIFTSTMLK